MGRIGKVVLVVLAGAALGGGLALGSGDDDDGERPAPGTSAPRQAARATPVERPKPALCRSLRSERVGRVRDAGLTELSGLVGSRRAAGSLWAIEDSGAGPVLHAFSRSGAPRGTLALAGATNVDWEDIAVSGRGADARLYAADIGDNRGERASIALHRVAEPALPIAPGTQATAETLTLRYESEPQDAEALLIDPRDGTVVVVTKGIIGGDVYVARPPAGFAGEATLRAAGGVSLSLVTAGDVSADGRIVALRSYGTLAVWERRGGEPLLRTLERRPCLSPTVLRDGQGEALALSATGGTAWTVAERTLAPILRLRPR